MIVKAVMVPHPPIALHEVGRGEEEKISNTLSAFRKASEEIRDARPETVIVLSPHALMYRDYFNVSSGKKAAGNMGRFRARNVSFDKAYDEEFTHELTELLNSEDFPGGTEYDNDKVLDHGTMVPLYFIRKAFKGGKIVRLGLSALPYETHYRLGEIVQTAASNLNRRIVFVASGDLSHKLQEYGPYGFAKEGPEYDKRLMDVCSCADFGELFNFDEDFCCEAAECGHRSFLIMAGVLDGMSVKPTAYSHEDVTGVGYGICSFFPQEGKENG